MDSEMKNVLVSAPSYDGKVNVWHVAALAETIKIGLTKNINIVPIYMSFDALIQRARNDIFKLAYESKVSDLMMIDCDVDWNPMDFFRLLEHDVDIVAAPIIKKADSETYSVKLTKTYKILENGLVEVDGCATGMMRIRYNAIKKLWKASPEYKEPHKQDPCRMVFDIRIVDGELVSEDILFCQKWTNMGGKIYIDPKVNCGHSGERRWMSNFNNWMNRVKLPVSSKLLFT